MYNYNISVLLNFVENERRRRDIYCFLLLPYPHGRAMGREEKTYREFGRRSHAGGEEHRTFRRHIHHDR